MTLTDNHGNNPEDLDFESLVNRYYRPLYQFAFSLTHSEADASDLTQQTFYIWAAKGNQLRDALKVKTWLFTTLHREFLASRRKFIRFHQTELDEGSGELPDVSPEWLSKVDVEVLLEALQKLNEANRAAVVLFYLEDLSYKEIAAVLGIPLGTVQSRIARGLSRLQQILASDAGLNEEDEHRG